MVCLELAETGGFKARLKNDQIRSLAEAKLNTIADRFSATLTDDTISDEEFSPVFFFSKGDKYDRMKAEVHRRQKQGLSY